MKQNKTITNKEMKKKERELKQGGNIELRNRLPRGAIQQIALITGKVKGDPKIIFLALEYAKLGEETRAKVLGMIERNSDELKKIS
jgi:hypothetical protein